MNQFWMVYGIGTGAPTVRHHSEASAAAEASRLARSHPGITFVVLESVKAIKRRDVEVLDLRSGALIAEDDDIPF